jgi:hypothetical protein
MRWTRRLWTTRAALSGLIAVSAGAFAAHGVADPTAKELLRTGSTYAFLHALATLACAALVTAGMPRARFAPAFFLAGVLLFSGSRWPSARRASSGSSPRSAASPSWPAGRCWPGRRRPRLRPRRESTRSRAVDVHRRRLGVRPEAFLVITVRAGIAGL